MDEGDVGSVDNSLALILRRLEDNDDSANEGSRNEILQMQRIRELDMEPLEEEEDDSEADNSNDSRCFNRTPLSFLRINIGHFAEPGCPYLISVSTMIESASLRFCALQSVLKRHDCITCASDF